MENAAILLIAFALFLLVIILGLLTLLLFRLVKQNSRPATPVTSPGQEPPHPELSKSDFHPAILERLKEIEGLKPKRADLFCPNHTEEPGEVSCAICDKIYCKSCIKPFKSMHLCREHFPLVMRHEWEEILTLKTSTSDPEQGVKLYDIKRQYFEQENLPTYIETHYKINVDQDYIETYLVLFGIREDAEKLKEKFSLIQPH